MQKKEFGYSLRSNSCRLRVEEMSTRGSREKRKEWDKRYLENLRKDAGKMEERRRKRREASKRKRIAESLLQDAQAAGERREKRMRMSKEKVLREVEESGEV